MPDIPIQDPTPGQLLAGPQPPQQVGNTPLATRLAQDPSLQPQAPPQPTPDQVAQHNRHAAIGKAASWLFGQQRDPNTGEPVKQAPGAVFRSLLAGALLGGAIGSEAPAGGGKLGGFLSGFARGGNAVNQQDYEREQQQYQRAQQQKQMTLEQQRAADEHMLHQATAAHLTAETVAFHHQQEWHDQDVIDKKNAASALYLQTLVDAGGRPAPIAINGKVSANGEYSAPDIAAAFVKDPSLLNGPPNAVRHFVDVHNASDLEYVAGKGWLNQRGDPVDLSKSTTVKVVDVPENTFRRPITHTGREINVIAGYQIIPADQLEKTFTAPLEAYSSMYAQNLKNANQAAQAKQRDAKANADANKAAKRGTPGQFAQVEAKKASALAKAEVAYEKNGDEAALASAKSAAMKAYEDELKALGGSINPAGRAATPAQPAPVAPKKGDTQVHAGFIYNFDGSQWVKGQAAR